MRYFTFHLYVSLDYSGNKQEITKNMAEKNAGSRSFTLIAIAVVVLVIIGAIGYGIWVISAGSGEASQDIGDVAPDLESESGEQVYQIEPAGSEARFYINEVLNGEDVRVVGATKEVGGQLTINLDDPSQSTIGTIVINARTIETDNGNRNRALRNNILRSANDEYEFIRFEPTALTGLPSEPVEVGTEINFQVVGNLTILDTTNEVTFDTTATLGADNIIEGLASTEILYADYGISIPRVPFVASVEDNVLIELDFIATPMSEEAEATEATEASE